MMWAIILGGAAAAAIFAITKGQNPLYWGASSVLGLPLLAIMPTAKGGLGERKRARREVGNKIGLGASGISVAVVTILAIVGVL